MADVKKYYYMRLKENFFDSEEMVLLESMQDGIQYSNILIKMYLKSLKSEGRLMFKDAIPYNPQMIATITRHQVGTVEKALGIFSELGLIEILSDGAIYMNDIELFIGKTSTEGERKKLARMKIEQQKLLLDTNNGQMSDVYPPELELEKELEIEIKKKKKTVRHKYETCDMENAKLLFDLMLNNNPNVSTPNFEEWANTFRLMREDKKKKQPYTDEQVKYIIDWCQNDSFWKSIILSPAKLRKQFDGLVVKMKAEKERGNKQQYQKPINPWEEYLHEQAGSGSITHDDNGGVSKQPKFIEQRFDI